MLDSFPHIQPILHAIVAAGGRPQIVGGAVRDLLRGEAIKDVDIEVYGLPIDRLVELLGRFGHVDAVGRSFGVLKLRLPDGQEIDIALPRRESKVGAGHRGFMTAPDPTMTPREAAARRDFTWNALALTHTGELLDFFGGVADLEAGIIRHTTAAFAEDPLRVLRAMQLAARLDMRLAPETAELCRALLPEAAALAVERIWGEWQKWALKSVNPAAGLQVLIETGWITLYPELVALIDCPQNEAYHPEGNAWKHTLYVCNAAATIAERDRLAGEERIVLLFAADWRGWSHPQPGPCSRRRCADRGAATADRLPARDYRPSGAARRRAYGVPWNGCESARGAAAGGAAGASHARRVGPAS